MKRLPVLCPYPPTAGVLKVSAATRPAHRNRAPGLKRFIARANVDDDSWLATRSKIACLSRVQAQP